MRKSQGLSTDTKKIEGRQVNIFGLHDPHRFTTVVLDSVGTSNSVLDDTIKVIQVLFEMQVQDSIF